MIFKNYYKLLELPQNIKSSQSEIKVAYRTQAKKYHPDVNIQNKAAEERFKDINEAYKILSDPIQKRKYDKQWYNYVGKKIQREKSSKKEISANDIVNMFFGKSIQKKSNDELKLAKKGANIETSIEISIKEAFDGTNKKITLTSLNEKNKNISFDIPAGIQNGQKIRIQGKGKSGINGGDNGDLIINIDIKGNGTYQLEGDDIYVKLYISPWDAALGSKAVVDGIDGEITVLIPKGTQNGDKISIPQKGYLKNDKQRGNLIIKTEIMIPKQLSSEEKELLTELKKISKFNPNNIVNIK